MMRRTIEFKLHESGLNLDSTITRDTDELIVFELRKQIAKKIPFVFPKLRSQIDPEGSRKYSNAEFFAFLCDEYNSTHATPMPVPHTCGEFIDDCREVGYATVVLP